MNFFLSSICFLSLVSSCITTSGFDTQHLCHPDQREALLEFKNDFDVSDVSSNLKTRSWVSKTDCCSWDGITCDAKSGNVIGLDLSSSDLNGQLQFNSSLFRLQHLRDLNLAYNNFTGSSIPAEFVNLIRLERLNLSRCSISGPIPNTLLQLTKLVSLDLSSYYGSIRLSIDNSFLHLLAQNLRNLRELELTFVNISSEIPHEFSNMRSLRLLHLRRCDLFGEFPSSVFLIPTLESIKLDDNPNLNGSLPVFLENNSLLKFMSIYNTAFSGTIPESISKLKHLTSLNFFLSSFSGKIPFSLGYLSNLSSLILDSNNFVGEIPSSIGNLKQLTSFRVTGNKLSGNLPTTIVNCTQLVSLYLDSNQFIGSFPLNISQLSRLESFSASHNFFRGSILSSLLKIPSLTDISLDYNQQNDLLGIENISLLTNLQSVKIYRNNYNKISAVDLNVFSPLKQLHTLSLSGIPLTTTNITSDLDFPSLGRLCLSECNITEFPEFIRYRRHLSVLDLSNNNIKGQVPDWFWRLPKLYEVYLSNNSLSSFNGSFKASAGSRILVLDLRRNSFQGPLFILSNSLGYLYVSKNNFSGEIPQSICGFRNLYFLDLSDNNFHGSIPRCLEHQLSSLADLNLRNNSFSGSLPEIFANAKNLESLDVSHNRLQGKLPASLTGCSILKILNVGNNRIKDKFPFWLSSLQKLQVLVLRSNKFHGLLHKSDGVWFGFPQLKIIDVSHNDFFGTLSSDYFLNWTGMSSNKEDNNLKPTYIGYSIINYYYSLVLMSKGASMEMERILTIYTAIDFSGNQLHGTIPESVGLLKELLILDLSNNAFTGHIPSSLANLKSLQSLDISQNNISGEIPPELGTLSSLAWINVSYNQLEGSIPQATQFHTQKCSSYQGNPRLDVLSLKGVCGDIKEPTPPQPETEAEDEKEEESVSWVAAGYGFAPGVVFGLTMGYIVAKYKHEWFMQIFGPNKQRSTRTR